MYKDLIPACPNDSILKADICKHTDYTYYFFDKEDSEARCVMCGGKVEKKQKHQVESVCKARLHNNVRGYTSFYRSEEDKKYKHRELYVCDSCGREGLYKDKKYGTKGLQEVIRYLVFYKDKHDVVAVQYIVTLNFNKKDMITEFYPYEIYRFSENGVSRKRVTYDWKGQEEILVDIKKIKLGTTLVMQSMDLHIYEDNLSEVIKDTCLEYSLLDKKQIKTDNIIEYLYEFLKYTSIEKLVKAGFSNLLNERYYGKKGILNLRGNTLKDIFKLSKKDIKDIKKYELNLDEIECLKECRKFDKNVNSKTIKEYADKVLSVKLIRCFEKYKLEIKRTSEYIIKNTNRSYDYLDFLNDISKLELKLKHKEFYPKDFEKRHTELSQKVYRVQNKIKSNKFKKAMMEHQLEYVNDQYLIVIPTAPSDLLQEGENQHNCVASYVDKVINKTSIVLFIRNINNPSKSLYTLELNTDYQVEQCRAYANQNIPEEVKVFLDEYTKHLISNNKKKEDMAA